MYNYKILGVIFLLAGFIGFTQNAHADLNDGLVSYYPFNGNANDNGSFGNHGTEYGGITYANSNYGQALLLDGVNDYIKIPNENQYDFENKTFSLSGWFKTDSTESAYILAKDLYPYCCSSGGWGVSISGKVGVASKSAASYSPFGRSTNNTYNDNKWHHFAIVIKTSTTVRTENLVNIYIDGTLEQSDMSYDRDNYIGGSNPLYIGRRDDPRSSANHYNGMIDEIRIYNRALTTAEIQQLAAGGTAPSPTPTPTPGKVSLMPVFNVLLANKPKIFLDTFTSNNLFLNNWNSYGSEPNNNGYSPNPDYVDLQNGYARLKLLGNQGCTLQSEREDFHFGRYRFDLKIPDTSNLPLGEGMVFGAFIFQKNYTDPDNEIDIEFLTIRSGKNATNQVNFVTHTPRNSNVEPVNGAAPLLPYGSLGVRCIYGFDWHPDKIDFFINGYKIRTITGKENVPQKPGRLILNIWSGNPSWGGTFPSSAIYGDIYNVSYEPAFF